MKPADSFNNIFCRHSSSMLFVILEALSCCACKQLFLFLWKVCIMKNWCKIIVQYEVVKKLKNDALSFLSTNRLDKVNLIRLKWTESLQCFFTIEFDKIMKFLDYLRVIKQMKMKKVIVCRHVNKPEVKFLCHLHGVRKRRLSLLWLPSNIFWWFLCRLLKIFLLRHKSVQWFDELISHRYLLSEPMDPKSTSQKIKKLLNITWQKKNFSCNMYLLFLLMYGEYSAL